MRQVTTIRVTSTTWSKQTWIKRLAPGGSPVKAALEVTRILRDQIRAVIEFGGLSLESYIDFQSNVRGRINRLEAGPPPLRSQQLLGLLDAGAVQVPFGPHPEVTATDNGKVRIRSTKLDEPSEAIVNGVVRGHLDLPVSRPIQFASTQPTYTQRAVSPR